MLERVWRKKNTPRNVSFGRNVNWLSHYGEQYGASFKMKTELSLFSSSDFAPFIQNGKWKLVS